MSFFQDILDSLQPRDLAVDPTGKLAPVNKIDLTAMSTPGPVTNKIDLNALTDIIGSDPKDIDIDTFPLNTAGPPAPHQEIDPGASKAQQNLFASVLAAIEQESQGERAKLLNPPADPETVPAPVAPAVVEQLASAPRTGGIAAPSSAKKSGATSSTTTSASAKDKELEAMLEAAGKTNDRSGERGDLANKQANLLARAEGEKELSDEEKIAIALLGTLPGLVGAIGGGAIAGGYGAAAGAAGGLQGGAMGVNSIAEAKQARRKEAKTEAQILAERIAKLDDMMAAEKTRAADKQLEISLSERAAKRADARAAEDRKASWATANLNNAAAMQRTMYEANKALEKAILTAKTEGKKKITDTDVSFAKNVDAGMRAAREIEDLVKAGGANIGAHISNEGTAQLLDQALGKLAHAYTKIGDPNSAVLLGELENTRKTLLSEPTTTRTGIFLKKVKALENEIANRAVADYRLTGIEHPSVVEWAERGSQQQKQPPHGMYVQQDGKLYKWTGTSYEEAN